MKLRKGWIALLAAAAAVAALTACGGSSGSAAAAPETAAPTTEEAKETTAAQPETEGSTEAESPAEAPVRSADAGEAGKYVIYEYEGNGNKVSHETLVAAGMGDTYLELYPDGTGQLMLFQSLLDITWGDGKIKVYGTSEYGYEINGDTLYLDMQGVYYTMIREGTEASSGGGHAKTEGGSVSGKAASVGEPYINDGTIEGIYLLWKFMDMSLAEWSEISGTSMEETARSMQIEILDDKTAKVAFDTEEAPDKVAISIDGDILTMEADRETLECTLKDGLLTMDMEGAEIVLARLTDAAYAVPDKGEASVWTGQYTKYVGDDNSARDEEEEFRLELYDDGTGVHHRDGLDLKVTWTLDGTDFTMQETFMGVSLDYTGTLSGDDLSIFNGDPENAFTCEYVYVREGGSSSAKPAASSGTSASSGVPAGVPAGDGLISEEDVEKGYVWMNKVAKDIFHTTYEELAEHFGVDGEFDKEEFDDFMGHNKRYYKWISKEDPYHFIYVNFQEDNDDGIYYVSSFNSSGFTSSEAEAKYLDEVKAEASAADKAAAASAVMKKFSVDIHPFADKETTVTVSMEIPESGWAYDEKKDHLVENEDVDTFGAGFIQFELDDKVEDFDFYKDKFENYREIDDREIGGISFRGRTYKNIGYEWTEYIAQIEDGKAISVGIVRVDISDGSMGDRILNSIQFK